MNAYPQGMTEDLAYILGQMVFTTAPLAHVYRAAGHTIASKVEAEQAFILDRQIRYLMMYGDNWRTEFEHDMKMTYAEAKRLADLAIAKEVADKLDQ